MHDTFNYATMAHNRPSKCQHVGGAYHDPIPFADDLTVVHAREGRLIQVGNELLSIPAEQVPQHETDSSWDLASDWLPIDDPQYALDTDGEWYDDALERDIKENSESHPEDTCPGTAANKKTWTRKRVSVSLPPHIVILALNFL